MHNKKNDNGSEPLRSIIDISSKRNENPNPPWLNKLSNRNTLK